MYDVNFIEPKSDSEKRQELIESINRYSDKRLSKGQKEVLQRAIENLPNILDAQQLFDWLTIARADSFNFDYTPVYSNSKIAVLKKSEILNGCINPKINEATGQRDYLNENKLIIGDNFDALNNLLLTHKGKIDVIYIDPPYNTDSMKNDGNHADERLLETLDQKTEDGKSKFVYNDSFYRDDWLSMMKLRLEKAKKLMSAGGVIFVSIDDSEQAYLKVLMDEIFGEENFVENIVWLRNPGGKSDSKYFAETKDYVLVYAKNINNISINNLIEEINLKGTNFSENEQRYWKQGSSITKSGSNSLLTDRKNLGFVIYYNADTNDLKIGYDYDIKLVEKYIADKKMIPENEDIYKFDQNLLDAGYIPYVPRKIHQSFGRWRMGAEKVKQLFKDNLLIFKNDNIYVKDVFYVENPYKEIKPKDWIDWTTNSKGTNEVKELGLDFSSPKPTQLIRYLINLHPNKNAIVLDFFAGSGTTGQAVMDLNREDGGNRKFILCTNNQNKIGEKVCAERLYRVITGKTSDGKSDFDWIKNNEAYSNESVGIYETKITDLDFDPEVSNVKSIQDLGNDAIRVYSQFSNEIINENVFNALTTLPIIERKED